MGSIDDEVMIEPEDKPELEPIPKQSDDQFAAASGGFGGKSLNKEALIQLKLNYMHKGIYLYECPACANHTIVNFPACHLCGTPNDFEDRTHKSFVLKPLSEACIADLVLLYEAQAAIQNKQEEVATPKGIVSIDN